MRHKDLTYKEISECKGVVTNIDDHDLPEDFFVRARGVHPFVPSKVCSRDFGSQHLYDTAKYPATNLSPSTLSIVSGSYVYDVVSKQEYDVIFGIDSRNYGHIYAWDATGSVFTPLGRYFTAVVNATPGASSTSIDLTAATFQLNGQTYSPSLNELAGYVIYNTTKSEGAYLTASTVPGGGVITVQATGLHIFGSSGLAWTVSDIVILYRFGGLRAALWDGNVGATPFVRWIENDVQKKVTCLYQSTDGTKHIPLICQNKGAARNYFWYDSTHSLFNVGAGWYVENGGGLCTYFKQFGFPDSGVVTDGATYSSDTYFPADAWLRIDAHQVGVGSNPGFNVYAKSVVTVMYDDYEESDPIFIFMSGVAGVQAVQHVFDIYINPGLMPKNVTGFRVYSWGRQAWPAVTSGDTQVIQAALQSVSFADMILDRTIFVQKYNTASDVTVANTLNTAEPKGRIAHITYTMATNVPPETNDNIRSNLNHDPVLTRSLLSPRFFARSSTQQGSVIGVDNDDSTISVSSYDGSGGHEDDNFPQVDTNLAGFKLRIALSGHGEIMGMGIQSDMLLVLHPSEIEFADFQSNTTNRVVSTEVISRTGIVQTPFGIVWCGNSAIFWYPENGGGVQILNQDWKNWWDGTLKTTNATDTPFMTLAQRKSAVAGYDPVYQSFWIHVNCQTEDGTTQENLCWWYSFIHKKWFVRKLAIGSNSVTFFGRRIGYMTIGFQGGLLKYPYQTGTGRYKDAVAIDGSGGTAFEVKGRINFGSLYNLIRNEVPVEVLVDQASTGTGAFNVRFYGNHDVSAFDDKTIPVTTYGVFPRRLGLRGSLERLQVEFELVGSNLSSILDFEINTLYLGFAKRERIGNR